MVVNVCLYFKFGHCKFQEICKYRHNKKECDEVNCDVENCESRHIRHCNFGKEYGRCKFGEYCSFKHSVISHVNANLVSVVNKLESKVRELENILAEKDIEISEIKTKMETFEKEKDDDKESNIVAALNKLEERQYQLEQETYSRCGDVESNIRNIVDALSAVEDTEPNACNICKRSFGNHRSLQNHMRNHHGQNIT